MFKAILLEASCLSDVVTAEGFPVDAATILSQGKGQSSGLLIMFGEQAYYIPNAAEDLKTTIEKLADAVTKISNILTAIGAGMTGPTTAPPPTLATDVVALTAIVTELNTLKGVLK